MVAQIGKVELNARRRAGAPQEALNEIKDAKRKAEAIQMLFFHASEKKRRPDKLKFFHKACVDDEELRIPKAVDVIVAKEM